MSRVPAGGCDMTSVKRRASAFRRPTAGVALAVLLATLSTIGARTAHAANPVQVTLTIQRFVEIQSPDGGLFGQTHGNYYGLVNIDNQGDQDTRSFAPVQKDNGDISPYWQFRATVDANEGTVPISIQIKDEDTGVPFSVDDVMDINPHSDIRTLRLSFNLQTG